MMSSAWFLADVTIGIQAKEFNLGFIRPENQFFSQFFSHGLGVPFGKLQACCHVPFSEEWLPSGHSTIKA